MGNIIYVYNFVFLVNVMVFIDKFIWNLLNYF